MKHPTLILIFITNLICATCSNATAQTTVQLDSTILTVDTIITGLDVPWELLWGPDNHLWLTERNGKISRVNPTNGQRKIILDHSSSVYQFYESGMLGLFLHPEFASKPFVYVAYTYLNNSTVKERISRFTYSLDSLTNEEVLVENIPGNTTHIGCRFLLLPDQTLIFTTGDARKDQDAQNPALLNGKVMRMKLDGSIPADNPIANSYVWSWGLRNTQGLALGPNNIIYGSEHGPTSDDELNILEIGRNYGWPNVEGMCNSAPELQFCQDSNVVEPIFTWTPTIAPSDLIYYQHASIPELNNTLVMTVLKDKRLIA
ncbi:MAG: glucose/arabinose dehydrogenase, partial [Bacteroidia bacterium]